MRTFVPTLLGLSLLLVVPAGASEPSNPPVAGPDECPIVSVDSLPPRDPDQVHVRPECLTPSEPATHCPPFVVSLDPPFLSVRVDCILD